MATTSIWSIKNNLKQSINYIINPEKTINEDYGMVVATQENINHTHNYFIINPVLRMKRNTITIEQI